MFEKLEMAPADPILGLTEAYNNDPNPNKINLGVGVYKDETGVTPIMTAVAKAEKNLLDTEKTKSYLPLTARLSANCCSALMMHTRQRPPRPPAAPGPCAWRASF